MDISDLFPTILDLAKCEPTLKNDLDGKSHFHQIWEGFLNTPARIEILHGIDSHRGRFFIIISEKRVFDFLVVF